MFCICALLFWKKKRMWFACGAQHCIDLLLQYLSTKITINVFCCSLLIFTAQGRKIDLDLFNASIKYNTDFSHFNECSSFFCCVLFLQLVYQFWIFYGGAEGARIKTPLRHPQQLAYIHVYVKNSVLDCKSIQKPNAIHKKVLWIQFGYFTLGEIVVFECNKYV